MIYRALFVVLSLVVSGAAAAMADADFRACGQGTQSFYEDAQNHLKILAETKQLPKQSIQALTSELRSKVDRECKSNNPDRPITLLMAMVDTCANQKSNALRNRRSKRFTQDCKDLIRQISVASDAYINQKAELRLETGTVSRNALIHAAIKAPWLVSSITENKFVSLRQVAEIGDPERHLETNYAYPEQNWQGTALEAVLLNEDFEVATGLLRNNQSLYNGDKILERLSAQNNHGWTHETLARYKAIEFILNNRIGKNGDKLSLSTEAKNNALYELLSHAPNESETDSTTFAQMKVAVLALIRIGATVSLADHSLTKACRNDLLEILFDAGITPPKSDDLLPAALFCYAGRSEEVAQKQGAAFARKLVQKNLIDDFEGTDLHGNTLLMRAAENCNPHATELLIKYANKDTRNVQDQTALDLAQIALKKESAPIERCLVTIGILRTR